jgi:hypothetical protein
MPTRPSPNKKGAIMPDNWKSISEIAVAAFREYERARLKRRCIECMNDGQFELAEAYHAKLIEMEAGK